MNNWDALIGQRNVKSILNNVIASGKIPHAFLFTGNEGVGKDFCAVQFARNVNSGSGNPEITNSISNLSEPFIKYIFPLPRGKNENEDSSPYEKLTSEEMQLVQEQLDIKKANPYYKIRIPKANQIKVSSIRDIKKFLSFNYEDISYRIIIISDAHLMNEESQNALLKNLEEPPEGIIFILCTPYPNILRETIRSRCWQLSFQPLSDPEVREILLNYFGVEPSEAETVSHFARGSVSFALQLIDSELDNLLERTISIIRYSLAKRINSAFAEFESVLQENDPEVFKLVLQLILTWLNDVHKARNGMADLSFVKFSDTITKFNSKFPEADLLNAVRKLEYFISVIKTNVNINILALNTVNTLADIVSVKS